MARSTAASKAPSPLRSSAKPSIAASMPSTRPSSRKLSSPLPALTSAKDAAPCTPNVSVIVGARAESWRSSSSSTRTAATFERNTFVVSPCANCSEAVLGSVAQAGVAATAGAARKTQPAVEASLVAVCSPPLGIGNFPNCTQANGKGQP
ncbi:MAG: hypothetical protein WDN24_02550 [Sphingomonas sp.]